MALISKTSGRSEEKPVKLVPNVSGMRHPSSATWKALFAELDQAGVPDDFLTCRPDNGEPQVRQ
jgi:hypothetical protein